MDTNQSINRLGGVTLPAVERARYQVHYLGRQGYLSAANVGVRLDGLDYLRAVQRELGEWMTAVSRQIAARQAEDFESMRVDTERLPRLEGISHEHAMCTCTDPKLSYLFPGEPCRRCKGSTRTDYCDGYNEGTRYRSLQRPCQPPAGENQTFVRGFEAGWRYIDDHIHGRR